MSEPVRRFSPHSLVTYRTPCVNLSQEQQLIYSILILPDADNYAKLGCGWTTVNIMYTGRLLRPELTHNRLPESKDATSSTFDINKDNILSSQCSMFQFYISSCKNILFHTSLEKLLIY